MGKRLRAAEKSKARLKTTRRLAMEPLERRDLLAVQPVGVIVAPTPLGGIAAQNLIVATFTSQDSLATPTNFSAVVNWGDSSTSDASTTIVYTGTVATLGSQYEVIANSHTYNSTVIGQTLNVTVSISDSNDGSIALAQSRVTVGDAPITPSNVGPLTATAGTALSAVTVASFTDPDPMAAASNFTATIDWGDGSPASQGSIVPPIAPGGAYTLQGSHNFAQDTIASNLPFPITVTIHDTWGAQAVSTTFANVAQAALNLSNVPPINAIQGVGLTNATVATFVAGNPLASLGDYTATVNWGDGSAPSNATIAPTGGNSYSIQATHTFSQIGMFTGTVLVYDEGVLKDAENDSFVVSDAPLTATPTAATAIAGSAFNGLVALFNSANPGATATNFIAHIDWGNGTTTIGTVTSQPQGFAVSGAGFVYPTPGSYTTTVTIQSAGGQSAQTFGVATVGDSAISNLNASPLSATAGASLAGVTVAQFMDSNSSVIPGDFTASIDWGDGSAPTIGTVVAPLTLGSAFSVTGSHVYSQDSTTGGQPFPVTVSVKDIWGGQTVATTSTSVAQNPPTVAPAPSISAVAGVAMQNKTVASFAAVNLAEPIGNYTASINWGDGTASTAGFIIPLGGGRYAVQGSHTYAQPTTTPLTTSVSVFDEGILAGTVNEAAVVADPALTSAFTPITAVAGVPFNGAVAQFSSVNPGATASDFIASINWGNGDQTTGTVVAGPGGFAVLATSPGGQGYAYPTSGNYSTTVSISSHSVLSSVVYGSAAVSASPLSVQTVGATATVGTPVSGALVATFSDPGIARPIGQYLATINWGDGSAPSVGQIVANGAGFILDGTHTFASAGSFTGGVTVSDAGGAISTVPFTSTSSAPTLTSLSVNPAEAVALNNAPLVTVAGSGGQSLAAGNYSATINWGDGTAPTMGIVVVDGANLGIDGSHIYISSGTYPIQVILATPDSSSVASISFPVTVAATPLTLSGQLNPSSDSGASSSDGITNVSQPDFFGTSEPDSIIQLFAISTGGSVPVVIGSTTTSDSGVWNLTSSKLADGSYTILARATDPHGGTTTTTQILPGSSTGPLVIDTTGPQVTGLSFNRVTGKVTVALEDSLSGLNQLQVDTASNYQLTSRATKLGPDPIFSMSSSGSGLGSPEIVTLQYRKGTHFPKAQYLFTVLSNAGIHDIAGNALDGQYSGGFPSGEGQAGTDFVAKVVMNGNRVSTLGVSAAGHVVTKVASHPRFKPARFFGRHH